MAPAGVGCTVSTGRVSEASLLCVTLGVQLPPQTMKHALSFAALLCALAAQAQEQPKLPTTRLNSGMYNINAELARTPQQREIGLMGRRSMGDSDGMLFVFEQPGVQCFWMKNTLLPLSIAFIADDGTVVDVADMKPQSLDSHCSSQPVRYALEMNKGWFAKRGVKAGSKLGGEPFGQR